MTEIRDLVAGFTAAEAAMADALRRLAVLETERAEAAVAVLSGARAAALETREVHPNGPVPMLGEAPPPSVEENDLRARLPALEAVRDAALAAVAGAAPEVRALLRRLAGIEGETAAAHAAVAEAEDVAASAEAHAVAASLGDDADVADRAATDAAATVRRGRRRAAALEAEAAAIRAELRVIAPALRGGLDTAADGVLAGIEKRFAQHVGRAHAALAEAVAVAAMTNHHAWPVLRAMRLPDAFKAGAVLPLIGDWLGQRPAELPKAAETLAQLAALTRDVSRIAPPERML